MAEVAGLAFPRGAEPDDTFFNVGFKYNLTKQAALIGSFGRSFHGVERGTPDLLTFLGVQLMLGGNKRANEGETDEKKDPVSGREARWLRTPTLWR
jgi:hypothetical protein